MRSRAVRRAVGRRRDAKGVARSLKNDDEAASVPAALLARAASDQPAATELLTVDEAPAVAETRTAGAPAGQPLDAPPSESTESASSEPAPGDAVRGFANEQGPESTARLAAARAAAEQHAGTSPDCMAPLVAVVTWKQALDEALRRDLGEEAPADIATKVQRAAALCTVAELDDVLGQVDRVRSELVDLKRILELLARWRRDNASG